MNDEQRQLVTDNHNLIYGFLNKYGLDREDFYDLAAIGLCKAAETWNKKRGVFSTYAYRCMLNVVRTENRAKNVGKRIPENMIVFYNTETCSDDGAVVEFINYIPYDIDVEKEAIDRVVMGRYLNKLDELDDRDRLIFWLLIDGYSLREIGKIIGCSHHNIAYIKSKIVKKLMGVRSRNERL